MSVNLQKIGTVLLNMDDVAQELNIKGVRRYDDEASNEYFSPLIARDELEPQEKSVMPILSILK